MRVPPIKAPSTDRQTLPAFFSFAQRLLRFYHFGLYLLVLPYVGMLVGNMLFSFILLTALAAGDQSFCMCVALMASGGMWLLFTYVLEVFFARDSNRI